MIEEKGAKVWGVLFYLVSTILIFCLSTLPGRAQSPASRPAPLEQQSTDAPPAGQEGEPQTAKPTPGADQSNEAPNKSAKPQTDRERGWEMLRSGLEETSAEKRAKAVNALGLLSGDPEAEAAAEKGLEDQKSNVRLAAATALGSMHAIRAKAKLEKALDDDEPTVVLAAANSLMLLKDTRSAYDVYYGVLTGNMRTNKGLVGEQMKTLHDPKKMAQLGFEEGIGFIPFAGFGYGVMKTVMKSDSSPLRAAAAKKLAHDPDPQTGEALVAATQDKNWIVRAAALEAIAQRGDKKLLTPVILALDDDKEDVRYMAAACTIHLSDLPFKRQPKGAPTVASR